MTTDITTTPAPIQNLPTASGLSQAYASNVESVARAQAAGAALTVYDPTTMTTDQDAELAEFLVRARRTLDQLQLRRNPITKAFDAVRAEFVRLESQLDPKKPDNVVARIQAIRDGYAARLRAEEAARLEELRRQQRALEEERRRAEQAAAEALAAAADAEQRRQVAEQLEAVTEQYAEQAEELIQHAAQALPEVPKGRAGVRVTVTDPRAYVALLAVYVERERRTLDQLNRLTLGQLVTYAERLAIGTGEVLEVEGLQYDETFRTVAR